ncbi:hypothetical protein [Occallatibacter savannae]|uniref:hypothetical protein n=1 Tax=Occallatibacter savannae TaxID=1002691 RepID=UPI000D687AF1|nr:hypothetical protein [Occallatibacter savannae]
MHFNYHFTAVQILWTLTFAALLVLLVVLLGRDRIRRFPWFTTGIVLVTLRLLINRLLHDRLPPITMGKIAISLALVSALVSLIVLVEMARRAFRRASARAWLAWTLGLLVIAGLVVWKWGPWPNLRTLAFDTLIAKLQFMQFIAVKLGLLTDVLSVCLGLLVVAVGSRYAAGWRSHVQRIMIGLSTASLAQMAAQGIWQTIARHTTPHSQAEYEHVIGIQEKLLNTNSAVYVLVIIWWIVCLWPDEPSVDQPEAPGAPS